MISTTKTENGLPGTTLRQRNKGVYWAWKAMKQRCMNPKCHAYKNYGARGISVCSDWIQFEPFCEWALSNGYRAGLDLDRIDNSGGYRPENCRWVGRRENVNNRRKTLRFAVGGIDLSRTEWEEKLSLPHGLLKAWSVTHGRDYVEMRIADIIENGYREKDFGYSHRKRLIHCESGKIFNSVRSAAEYFGIAPCTISNAIRDGRRTGKGRFNYEILEETED